MRSGLCAALAVALAFGTACAKSETDTPTTAPAGQAQAGAQTAPSGQAAGGAQATARITEDQLDGAMKAISKANGGLQGAIKTNMLMEAATNAKELATQFAIVERFFQQHNQPEAVKIAQTARTGATEAAAAASSGDQAKAAAGAAVAGATCKQCHSAYREGDAQTGYRVKAGIVTP